jgi:hypothetical protein
MTGEKYFPSEEIQKLPFGIPTPYSSAFGDKKNFSMDNIKNVIYANSGHYQRR